ncbi:MAG: amino acid ABC transporter permease [Microcystaceae cyanobacterium]
MNQEKIPFWRDDRILKIIGQGIVLTLIIAVFAYFINNLIINFQRLNLNFSFDFLVDPKRPASFSIGDSPIPYQSTDPFYRALLVGLLNSLQVMISGIVLASFLGIIVGISRLSENWLIRQLATIYVEILRNTPLLLQLFFWYFAVFLKLPKIDNPLSFTNVLFLSNQGIYLPWPKSNLRGILSLTFILFSIISIIILWYKNNQIRVQQGTSNKGYEIGSIGMAIAAIVALFLGLDWQFPNYNLEAVKIEGGLSLSPEFATLLVGLTVYTAAFIAEVVRAGIQSVSQGQWEAAKALGLSPQLVMQLVIFPQALRVMIPPLTSEFLNLAKNSSLAIAIGYNDIYAISSTIANKTGQAVQMLIVVMAVYLMFNLIISLSMNFLNHAVQLKER